MTARETVERYGDMVWRLALPQIYRTAIHLHYYEGLTVAEIARAEGCREGTVKARLHRGRELLKGALTE